MTLSYFKVYLLSDMVALIFLWDFTHTLCIHWRFNLFKKDVMVNTQL